MIYLDNASTTMPNEITMNYLSNYDKFFGNPSNIYKIGDQTHEMIENARIKVAKAINAEPEDIYFTSGASESNAWAIAQCDACICSPYEHHSIMANPKAKGNIEFLTLLYSHMLINNETGEVFDIKEKFQEVHRKKYLTHTDATQAIGNIFVNVKDLDADMLSLSGHKFHAPKGIGVLYINHTVIPRERIKPLIYGSQENNCRGGTENVLGIVCLGDCIKYACDTIAFKQYHCDTLKKIVIEKLKNSGIDYLINSPKNSIPAIINFSLKDISNEVIASILSEKEIYIGTGSACNTGDIKPSYVLQAMGCPKEYIRGAIRLSFSQRTTSTEVDIAMDEIIKIYKELTK